MTEAEKLATLSQMSPTQTALVIGGGVSGMQASLDLADQGFNVVLVEKTPSIGGAMAMLDKTFPTLDCSACILTPKLSEVARHPNIELLTYSEVTGISGQAGNFKVKVLRKARKVLEDKCSGCGDCVEHCPIEIPNEFDQGLGFRRAVYVGFPQNTPLVYTIDDENCIKCEMCVKACEREAIDLAMKDEEVEIPVGAIVVATGFELFDVSKYPRLGYGEYKNVINALEYERLINAAGPTAGHLLRMSDGKIPKSIGFVQCVGARDVTNQVPYCARVCCMYGIKNAVMAKELQPDNVKNVTVYYADIRAYGKGFEEFYNMAQTRFGIEFIRGRVGEVAENPKTRNIEIRVENTETGEYLQHEHELVVLCPGILPPKELRVIASELGVDVDSDGYLFVEHPASNPVDTKVPGVFVCGCAEGPKDIPDSVAAGSAAAMRASITLAKGGEV
ncbi:MAG: CoB--CoM heterodisulfide reductase iron-sulfur subunit A family protein [Candidatus Thorarchaeota archaeon]|nr:MAG: CoB--CoM heterodisulfide reductase iron-sulfur subunit A family protein [Candidatus Thorarchaeota archaeon]